jgi:hypothetical protein
MRQFLYGVGEARQFDLERSGASAVCEESIGSWSAPGVPSAFVIGTVPASWKADQSPEATVMLGTILLVILILILIGALPTWPYSSGWGTIPAAASGWCSSSF